VIFLRVPAVLAYRDLVTRSVSAACKVVLNSPALRQAYAPRMKSQGADESFIHAMVSAVGEAFNNVVLHAYRDSAGEVEISIHLENDSMEVEMRDHGRSFDFEAVPKPKLEMLPESGLGIYIIRSLVDEVRYQRGSPNVLTMRKRLGAHEPAA
jgi:serine/threonine-protein kinase RsbW